MARPKKQQKPISNLQNLVEADTTLPMDIRLLFIEMSKEFDKDFSANLFLSSIELQNKYPFGLDVWQKFVTHPTISRYLGNYANEVISKKADADIMSGAGVRDAVAVKKELAKTKTGKNNFGFVIMYITEEEPRVYEPFDPID